MRTAPRLPVMPALLLSLPHLVVRADRLAAYSMPCTVRL